MINDWFASLSQEVSTCCHRTGSRDITPNRIHKRQTNDNQSITDHQTACTEIASEIPQLSQTFVPDHQTGSTEITFEKFQTSQTVETYSKNCDHSKDRVVGIPKNCLVCNEIYSCSCKEMLYENDKTIQDEISINENGVDKRLESRNIYTKSLNLKTGSTEIEETLEDNLSLKKDRTEFKDTGPRVCMVGLHCCGDLTPTMLKCFQELNCIRSLCCVSCCYHRMKFDGNIQLSWPQGY